MTLVDWIGFIGVFQILLAFALNVSNKLDNNSLVFILLNLFGSVLACTASVMMNYMPFIILEGVWALVSLFALIRHYKT
jgi:hypothetical protein